MFGRFFFWAQYIHIPVGGFHGSFVLCSGRIENEIGWNTDSLAEDAWFSFQVCSNSSDQLKRASLIQELPGGQKRP
jgi:hypothetical protein